MPSQRAIDLARPGDLVIIAGKGHEKTQVIGDRVLRSTTSTCRARRWSGGEPAAGQLMVALSRSPLVLTAAIVADAAEGRLRQGRPDQVIASFTTDTRRIAPGSCSSRCVASDSTARRSPQRA